MSVAAEVQLPNEDPLEVKGDLEVVGSSTVAPLIRRMYKRFILEGYRGVMNIRGVGTPAGFKLFCQEGSADIVVASRPIKPHETLACITKGLTPVEFNIGTDILAVVTNVENDFFDGASRQDLQKIFTANRWDQIDEMWPDEPIHRFIPTPGRGSFDFFVDAVFDGDGDALLAAANTAKERNPESIAKSVSNDLSTIGVVSYAFYKKYEDSLKTIAIDEVEPSPTAVERGDYLLTRSLFVYSDSTLMREKHQVRAFLSFLLNYVGEEIEQIGYFPLSDPILDESKLAFLEALGIEQ